jgi:tRNA1Val (adenine37-N6)-methyltransferase
MPNDYFKFKQFIVQQANCAMKVTTDACLFGAWVANEMADEDGNKKRMLDIGTGTGLLSLLIAQRSLMTIDAIEVDDLAAGQAKENVNNSPWKERITVIHGNVLQSQDVLAPKYDAIVSNPPFYEKELSSSDVRKNMAHHDEGLLLKDLVRLINEKLSKRGIFYLLLPYKRIEELQLLCQLHGLFIVHITYVKQSTEHPPFRVMITGKAADGDTHTCTTDEISIRDKIGNYEPGFQVLLKDYYLYL